VNLTLPPLRERIGDVRLLAERFVEFYSRKDGIKFRKISDEAMRMMESHSWPGNVRELENVVERAVITASDGLVAPKDIVIEQRNVALAAAAASELEKANWAPGRTLDDIERNVILEALSYHNGNRTHTARALGISIRTLRNKLAEYRKMGIRV
jgi:DNA-binding NtrC family response regulator